MKSWPRICDCFRWSVRFHIRLRVNDIDGCVFAMLLHRALRVLMLRILAWLLMPSLALLLARWARISRHKIAIRIEITSIALCYRLFPRRDRLRLLIVVASVVCTTCLTIVPRRDIILGYAFVVPMSCARGPWLGAVCCSSHTEVW